MKPDPKTEQRLVYATPTPPQKGSSPDIPIPYLLFGLCTIALIIGLCILFLGGSIFGLVIAIPAALGAIVLPFLSQIRED